MWVLAKVYGWNPEVIDELELEKMYFWVEGINWIYKNNG